MTELDQVRGELRRRGYLSHGVERFLLQDALRPHRPLRTLAILAVKVGALAGGVLALAGAIALAAVNGNLTASPFDLVALYLHLAVPAAGLAALAFLALGGLMTLLLRLYPVRRIEPLSFTVAVLAGVLAVLAALLAARRSGFALEIPGWQLALLGGATLAAAWVLIKVVHHGLLSLAIRLTDHAPGQRIFSRRGVGAVVAVSLVLLMLPVVMAARGGSLAPPDSLPSAPGDRVLVLGIDGVLPSEVDYLLARGEQELPALAALLARGGTVLAYERESEPPAARWTTVATGVGSALHGVAALDSYRPLGVATPLSRVGLLRGYFDAIEVPLGLTEYRPLLAHRRRAYAWWELAARGGSPIVVVNWWSTFPAAPLPGLVVAHDGYQLLGRAGSSESDSGGTGAVFPEEELPALRDLAADVGASGPLVTGSQNATGRATEPVGSLPADARADLLSRALRPDAFYRAAFRRGLARQPRAAALYLPGLDLAADGWNWGDVAFSDLLRDQLQATDRLLADSLAGFDTIAVVLDPGRRTAAGQGRLLLWRRAGCANGTASSTGASLPQIDLTALAAGLFRALGLPQSAELPPPPAACTWPSPPATVDTYGQPATPAQPTELGDEYLKGLKALGYL